MKKIGNWWCPDLESHPRTIEQLEAGGFQADRIPELLGYVDNFTACIDGGAHVGTWAAELALHFESVYAFEPDTFTFACLRQNIADRGLNNISQLNSAIGDDDKEVGIVRQLSVVSHYIEEFGTGVKLVKLDSISFKSLGLLKLDLEGYESRALLGAKETIANHRPVIMVEYSKLLHERGSSGLPTPDEILMDYNYHKVAVLGKNDTVWRPH